jgi:hypothetical protein
MSTVQGVFDTTFQVVSIPVIRALVVITLIDFFTILIAVAMIGIEPVTSFQVLIYFNLSSVSEYYFWSASEKKSSK